ncbi:glycoside hydrolase family 2 [candidate division KSB1 bacterium]|nr:glycoside hydrolase family 2 [candidate division KSB1 bacterium]
MLRLELNGSWKLYYFPQATTPIQKPADLETCTPIPAQVPGNVELDLMRQGILPDLFTGNKIQLLRAYELNEWWYDREFELPAEFQGRKLEIIFYGVDCLATYWLNGQIMGTSDNMLIEHHFEVTGVAKTGAPNRLTIRLQSPLLAALELTYSPDLNALATNWESLWIRKAPHMFGWDIMPRALSAGIWRGVELVAHDRHEIPELYFTTLALAESGARVRVFYQVDTDPELLAQLSLSIEGHCQQSHFQIQQPIWFKAGRFEFEIPQPALWWVYGYGAANLYQVKVTLRQGDSVLAEVSLRWGIRTVELVRTEITEKDQPGEFLLKINGVPIFCKGSNWVPADVFHSRDAARYPQLFELVQDSGCNILRSWGGNVYEDHAFFDFCDQAGVMVWQDFAMACAHYPQTGTFLEKIRTEATAVVRKLRNHPALVLWCGDNECDYFCADPARNRITREILPEVIQQHDPGRPYLPSSPYFAPEVTACHDANLMPEQHLWGPRDYYKSSFYTQATAHFISEIGYHGCPGLNAIERFIEKEYLWPWQENDQWRTHATETIGKHGPYAYRIQLMANQVKNLFGVVPDKLADFVIASQITQAEAFKFFIETTRIKKWRRTGIIWWNLIDGWPQFSDAVVDYYFNKKLAYHYIKRVQAPVCLMCDEPQAGYLRIFGANDTLNAVTGAFEIAVAATNEILLADKFELPANQAVQVGEIPVPKASPQLWLIHWQSCGQEFGNHYLYGEPPFNLRQYRDWLPQIAALSPLFEAPAGA